MKENRVIRRINSELDSLIAIVSERGDEKLSKTVESKIELIDELILEIEKLLEEQ